MQRKKRKAEKPSLLQLRYEVGLGITVWKIGKNELHS